MPAHDVRLENTMRTSPVWLDATTSVRDVSQEQAAGVAQGRWAADRSGRDPATGQRSELTSDTPKRFVVDDRTLELDPELDQFGAGSLHFGESSQLFGRFEIIPKTDIDDAA